ncbi:MAG TPA: FUSC family membrane protein [Castellaniella sp.]|uniref:FUSC family protein n=1 Tax=Castellaniella sp. TaxID=1955812 RepID=UPI002F0927E0
MTSTTSQLQRFFYSHYFFGGLRQSVGVLLPALVLWGIFSWVSGGFIAAVGAGCVAILDQPGGPRRYGINGMVAALCLCSVTTAITGLASSYALAIWVVVPALCFAFSMLTVYGKHGGLLGFACLLIMTLTMRTPMAPAEVWSYTLISFLGGTFYLSYSAIAHRVLWHREEQQALSVALFATADYIAARARFYDVHLDIEDNYRQLIRAQTAMTDAHQVARDMVLRELPQGTQSRGDRLRQGLLNLFVDMVGLLDSMVATHTDYATLRQQLPDSDILLFARDAMNKLANNIAGLALNVARNRHTRIRNSVKAELRAFEFELQSLRDAGTAQSDPELYALLVQVLRRLRNVTNRVDHMADHTHRQVAVASDNTAANKTLNRFLTQQKWRPDTLLRNLNMQSIHFRYALRVAAAAMIAMAIGLVMGHAPIVRTLDPGMAGHSYWIILTVLIIMKPGFALTRQRNGWRLMGTLLGCGMALVIFAVVQNEALYIFILIACSILGYGLVQVNYTLSALSNTTLVLMAFHLLIPGSTAVVGERLLDTAIGSVLALGCSYILPSWERHNLDTLAGALRKANLAFLQSGLDYVRTVRGIRAGVPGTDEQEAQIRWSLARKNVHLAFSNFTAAFYRMMDEPVRKQRHVPELNRLLIQNHTLASQIAAVIPNLAQMDDEPKGIARAIQATQDLLRGYEASPPKVIETEGGLATIAYPLRQMTQAAQVIRENTCKIEADDKPLPGTAAAQQG